MKPITGFGDPAASLVGSSYLRARRRRTDFSPHTGCKTLIRRFDPLIEGQVRPRGSSQRSRWGLDRKRAPSSSTTASSSSPTSP